VAPFRAGFPALGEEYSGFIRFKSKATSAEGRCELAGHRPSPASQKTADNVPKRSKPAIRWSQKKGERVLAILRHFQHEETIGAGATKVDRGEWLSSARRQLGKTETRIDHE
jgi:hypothetical protein